jgi:16S rRNA (guanine(527)-N(7))-methyltransferase RsmG
VTGGIDQNDKTDFLAWLAENYTDLSEAARGRLLEFGELVAEAGDRMGLVSRGDVPRVYMRHVRESLAPALLQHLSQGARVADIGSGGGFPGIPLAVMREDLRLALVEPRHRKGAFLERTVLRLGLNNTTIYTASLDALMLDQPDFRVDVVVARGLKWTPPMVDRLMTLVEEGGQLLRFGTPDFSGADVIVIPLDAATPRAIQVWPRSTWAGLPGAR